MWGGDPELGGASSQTCYWEGPIAPPYKLILAGTQPLRQEARLSFQEVNWHVGSVMGSSDHNEMECVTGGFLQWLLVAGEVPNRFLKCGAAGPVYGAPSPALKLVCLGYTYME